MDTVISLSDAQLLAKCKELGILPVPITTTTRDFIRKKVVDALNRREKNESNDFESPNISSTSPKSSSTPILDRIGSRSTVVLNSAASTSLDTSDEHVEPMDVDEVNGHEDDRPLEPPLKRPFFSSTMRNSPLLRPAPVIDTSLLDDGEKYLSEFGRRLSKMKTLPPNKELFKGRVKSDTIKETDFGNRLQPFKNTKTYELNRYDKNRQSTVLTSSNVISIVLVALLLIFFGTIGGYYFFIKSEFGDAYKQNYGKLICNEYTTKNCIEPENFDNVITAFKTIHIELEKRAVNYACGVSSPVSPTRPPFMTLNEASRFLSFRMDNDLKNLLLYVWHNNNFGVDVIEIVDDENYTFLDSIESILNEAQAISKRAIGLIVLNPNLSFSCTVMKYIKNYSESIIAVFIGFIGLLISYQLVKYFTNKKQKREEIVKDLVSQTIQMLQHKDEMKKEGKCSESYIPVNHIRDTLIPANKRLAMEKIWNEVKKTIKETESRLRVETRLVAGEEFEVWSWIGNHITILPRDPNAPKKWQGQAFESQAGSISPQTSPTSCLKIRGMINPDNKDLKDIEQSVIDKCQEADCKILHCASNRETASVYLKCASSSDAAIAYKELHGWWFDGKLVTVKYLRIERYNERFPESIKS